MSKVFQTAFGILLGLLVVGLAVGGISFLVLQNLSRTPPKPVFPEVSKQSPQLDIRLGSDNAYPAIVVYDQGLILRETPDTQGKVVDKLAFEETVIVTGESEDKQWQQVRSDAKGIEGWVRAGNLKRAQ